MRYSNGKARVVGSGKGAYFLSVRAAPEVCRENTPLTFRDIIVYHGPTGSEFNLKEWNGKGGTTYSLSVVEGQIHSRRRAAKFIERRVKNRAPEDGTHSASQCSPHNNR